MVEFPKSAAAAAAIVLATWLVPASAAEQAKTEPVRSAALQTASLDMPRHATADRKPEVVGPRSPDSNGWAMLAAGFCIGLLIIARRGRS